MSGVKRFMYVTRPNGRTLHIKYGNTSEGKTKCGRWAAPGWEWFAKAHMIVGVMGICKQCEAAA